MSSAVTKTPTPAPVPVVVPVSALATDTAPGPGRPGGVPLGRRLKGFVALTKPRIIELLLVTTVPTMIVAARGLPSWWLMAATVVGGTLAAGGANALNMVVDRDIDAIMRRTRGRPLVTGVISPAAALIFAIALEAVAFGELWAAVNLLSATLAVSATLFYVFVYTIWLKRTSRQNIVIGGAAGAVPVLVGWAAVRGSLGWAPVVLFALIFVWTPPHFWALAIRYREDYRSAKVPMMPVVTSFKSTAARILEYSLLVVAVSLLFAWVGGMGPIFWASAVVLGAVFCAFAVGLWRQPSETRAMRLFQWSISYLTLLFGAMAVDQLIFH
jgi:heme o synthase